MTKESETKCFIVFNGQQMLTNDSFTYTETKQFCNSVGGRLPIIKVTKEQEYLSEGLDKYTFDPVS